MQPAMAACKKLPQIGVGLNHEEWEALQVRLRSQMPQCLQDPLFFSLYGAALLNTDRVNQAVDALERALLLSPENGGVLLDYATALFRSGELLTALRLNRQLLSRKDLPEHLRPLLEERQTYWNGLKRRWSGRFTFLGGHSDNLNVSSGIKNLILTIDGKDVLVGIDKSYRPVSGLYSYSRLLLKRTTKLDDQQNIFSVAIQGRFSELSEADTDEVRIEYSEEYDRRNSVDSWSVSTSYYRYGDSEEYYNTQGLLKSSWGRGSCSPYVEGELKSLYFPELEQLNDISLIGRGGVRCGFGRHKYDVSLAYAVSKDLGARPGGRRDTLTLDLGWQASVGTGFILSNFSYSDSSDLRGYSPILESGAVRALKNTNFSVQYIHPIMDQFSFHAGYRVQIQKSNLALFSTSSESVDIGISYAF
jgi:tetratricopeptide (TPR) repeat protein